MPTKSEHKSGLTPEALADLQVPSDLHISPDGNKIVYALRPFRGENETPTSSIWISEVGKENSARQLTFGLFNDQQPCWSPDGSSVAFISDRRKPGKSSAIYVISPSGGEAYPLTFAENRSKISTFEWSPNGAFIAFNSADERKEEEARKEKEDARVWGENLKYHRLRILDVASRETRTLVGGDRHIHIFSWSPDGEKIAYVEYRDPDYNSPGLYGVKICITSLSTRVSTTIIPFPGRIFQFLWGDDGIYFIAGKAPMHYVTSQGLYRVSIDEDTYTLLEPEEESCYLGLQRNQSSLSYKIESKLEDEIGYIKDGKRHALYRAMHAIDSFDVFNSETLSVSAFLKSDGSNPDEVFSMTGSGDLVKLSSHNSALASLKISRAIPLEVKATDGYSLDGVMFVPSSYKESHGQLPTVLLPHGGPYVRTPIKFATGYRLEVPLLVSAGFGVVCPNYRGSSGRGQKHAAYARGGMGTVDYQDCIDVLKACIDKGFVDPSRVAIGGWSQGGYLASLAVTRDKFQFRAALCGAAVTDWDMMSMTSDLWLLQTELAGGAPWDVDEHAEPGVKQMPGIEAGRGPGGSSSPKKWIRRTNGRHGSPIWHMRHVKTPILILHGEEDRVVPLSQATAFYKGCIHNSIPVQMVTYPGELHFFKERKSFVDVWKRMVQFYEEHLNSI